MLMETDILRVLRAIEAGEVRLTPDGRADPRQDLGRIGYTTSTGWHLVVFNDAGNWDYLEEITAPDGRSAGFEEMDTMPQVCTYQPSLEVSREIYGIG